MLIAGTINEGMYKNQDDKEPKNEPGIMIYEKSETETMTKNRKNLGSRNYRFRKCNY